MFTSNSHIKQLNDNFPWQPGNTSISKRLWKFSSKRILTNPPHGRSLHVLPTAHADTKSWGSPVSFWITIWRIGLPELSHRGWQGKLRANKIHTKQLDQEIKTLKGKMELLPENETLVLLVSMKVGRVHSYSIRGIFGVKRKLWYQFTKCRQRRTPWVCPTCHQY